MCKVLGEILSNLFGENSRSFLVCVGLVQGLAFQFRVALDSVILLSQSFKSWDSRHVPPCTARTPYVKAQL